MNKDKLKNFDSKLNSMPKPNLNAEAKRLIYQRLVSHKPLIKKVNTKYLGKPIRLVASIAALILFSFLIFNSIYENQLGLNQQGNLLQPEGNNNPFINEENLQLKFETEDVPKINNALEKSPSLKEKIVGKYIKEGVFTILVIDDNQSAQLEKEIRKIIEPIYPFDEKISVKVVDYTEEELNYYQNLIIDSKEKLRTLGVNISYTSVNLFEGVIEVGILNMNKEDAEILKKEIGYNRLSIVNVDENVFTEY